MVVRAYECDALGHVNQAVYHHYAEHARAELLRAAGIPFQSIMSTGIAPVLLTATMRYVRELRANEEFDVTAVMRFGEGKTFRIESTVLKADGTVSAEFTGIFGLMDLTARKLVADPRGRLKALSTDVATFEAHATD